MIMKRIIHVLFLTLPIFLMSCKGKERIKKEQSDFFLQVPESEIGITCSKRIGAEFYIMFSKDSVYHLSDSIDYVKFETTDNDDVNIIFDPNKNMDIYIRESRYLNDTKSVNYNLHVLKGSEFDSLFFEPRITTQPLILKNPFIQIGIITSTYSIYMKKFDYYKKIKEGDIYGGW